MIVNVSKDGGTTFGRDHFICECRNVRGQYDPLTEVVPGTGAVYAVFMNDFDDQFSKSLDHGRTWSRPVPIYGQVAWGDKPNLGTSADGRDVYVGFNGPTDGDSYMAVSHDAGRTWTQVKVTDGERYYFAYGAEVLPGGTAVLSEVSFTYSGPKKSAEGDMKVHVFRSTVAARHGRTQCSTRSLAAPTARPPGATPTSGTAVRRSRRMPTAIW